MDYLTEFRRTAGLPAKLVEASGQSLEQYQAQMSHHVEIIEASLAGIKALARQALKDGHRDNDEVAKVIMFAENGRRDLESLFVTIKLLTK